MRVPAAEFLAIPLEVHSVLRGVLLKDVSAIDLPNGGPGRTMENVRTLLTQDQVFASNAVTRFLFGLRFLVGRMLGWDRKADAPAPATSYVHQLPASLAARSQVPPGTMDGAFRLLYVLDNETVGELQNATVHAFLCSVLVPQESGYRLYWAVYVKPVVWWTSIYMAAIEPFRRLIVYPSMFRRLRRAWQAKYG